MAHSKSMKIFHPDMNKALSADGAKGDTAKELQLFGEDTGPQLYHPPNNLVTKPVIVKNMPKIFDNLSIKGKPDPGTSLSRFYKNHLKMYLEVSDKQLRELAKLCSPENFKTGEEVMMYPEIPNPLLMNVHSEPKTPLADNDNPLQLKILDKNKERKEEDEDGRYLKKTLKYKHVHLIPLDQQARSRNDYQISARQMEPSSPVMTKKSKKAGKYKKLLKGKSSTAVNFKNDLDNDLSSGPGRASASTATGDVGPSADTALLAPDEQLEPGVDVLIKIRIYKPFDYEEYKNKSDGTLYNLFYHDVVLTGRNKVSDLKDAFICSEEGSTKETSHNGFLFIMNAFYVDYDEKAADHADSLRQWCSMRNFGDFPKHDVRTCRLDDLEIKLGNPDVYIHDTTCEHIIIFSDIRLLHVSDPLYLSDYPRVTSKTLHEKAPFCYNCVENNPKWIVSGCTRLPFNMALFCQECLKKLLYDEDGKKICKFKAYPYKGAEEKK